MWHVTIVCLPTSACDIAADGGTYEILTALLTQVGALGQALSVCELKLQQVCGEDLLSGACDNLTALLTRAQVWLVTGAF